MEQNTDSDKKLLYRWIKRIMAVGMIGLWFVLMIRIFQSGGNFSDQAPQCIFTTMIVFGILTAIYKGIEQIEKRSEE